MTTEKIARTIANTVADAGGDPHWHDLSPHWQEAYLAAARAVLAEADVDRLRCERRRYRMAWLLARTRALKAREGR